jgi:hypothetical protein
MSGGGLPLTAGSSFSHRRTSGSTRHADQRERAYNCRRSEHSKQSSHRMHL